VSDVADSSDQSDRSDRSDSTRQQRLQSLATPLLELSERRFDQAFMLLILIVVGWQLVASRQFSPEGRIFVVVIGVPTFLMTALLLLSELSSRVGGVMDRLSGELLTMGDEVGDMVGGDEIDETTASETDETTASETDDAG
jgi:hypothetical protein